MPTSEFQINREQLSLLTNSTRLEIYTSLRTDGPATAREIARRLDADEMTLYYHLRLLAKKGILATQSRATATKPESVYSVRGRMVVQDLDFEDERNRRDVQRNVESMLKTAGREYRNAVDQMRNAVHDRNSVGRIAVRLTPESRSEFQKRLLELARWLDAHNTEDGERFSFTYTLTPILPKRLG